MLDEPGSAVVFEATTSNVIFVVLVVCAWGFKSSVRTLKTKGDVRQQAHEHQKKKDKTKKLPKEKK